MITVNVGEPTPITYGDVWFDPTTMETHQAISSPTVPAGGKPMFVWSLITKILPTYPIMIGEVILDPITNIPAMWDGNVWVSAVPFNYNFPPANPSIGTLWMESMSMRDYIFVNGQWIDYNNAMATAQAAGSNNQVLTSTATTPTWQNVAFQNPTPPPMKDLHIYGPNNTLLITIHMDNGTVSYGPTYTPDAASQVFWSAVASSSPKLLQSLIDDLIVDLKAATSRLARAEDTIQKFKDAGFSIPEPPKPIDPQEAWDRAMGIIV